jgi:hypothetical protein
VISSFISRAKETDDNKYIKTLLSIYEAFYYLQSGDLAGRQRACEEAKELIASFEAMAELSEDEELANACFILHTLVEFTGSYEKYWQSLRNQRYKASWELLQDSMHYVCVAGRFIKNKQIFHLEDIYNHLVCLEKLYPYKVFISSELLKIKERCSICQRDLKDPCCEHIPGELYFGKMATAIIEKADLVGVSLVENPADKRLVPEVKDEQRPEQERFYGVHVYVEKAIKPFHTFEIFEFPVVSEVQRNLTGRNDLCPCNSGRKYKNCCQEKQKNEVIHLHLELRQILNFDVTRFVTV